MPKVVKKRSKQIHPNSRKAAQLCRKEYHISKMDRRKDELNIKQKAKLNKLKWFKEHLDEKKTVYTAQDMLTLIERYFHRFDEKVEKINEIKSMKCRQNKDHMKQEFSVKFVVEKEIQDFNSCGLEVPHLLNKESFEFFLAWTGDPRYLTTIDVVVLSRKNLEALISKEEK